MTFTAWLLSVQKPGHKKPDRAQIIPSLEKGYHKRKWKGGSLFNTVTFLLTMPPDIYPK